MKPRIGITSGLGGQHWHADGSSWRPYAAAVAAAGGEAIHLTATTLGREAAVLRDLDGLIFSGGNDIDLALYPNPPDLCGEDAATVMERHRMRPEPDRDRYELALLAAAVERDMPVLGICRGCQVLNVGLGGRLILDIPLETGTAIQHASGPEPHRPSGRHRLQVERDSLLFAALGTEPLECNSRHHQAVRVDEHLPTRVIACSEDGLVEAIEVPGRSWMVGVQWHPEHPGDPWVLPTYAGLFSALVRVAGGG